MPDLSTLDEPREDAELSIWSRRVGLVLVAIVVVLGLLSRLGVHTETRTSTGGGYELQLEYPAIARAGLDVTWRVTVTKPGGFGDDLVLSVTGDYFDIYESQALWPSPSEETRDGDRLELTFAAPEGDTFVLDYDAYLQPASQVGRSGTVAVAVGGRDVTSLDFRTRLLP